MFGKTWLEKHVWGSRVGNKGTASSQLTEINPDEECQEEFLSPQNRQQANRQKIRCILLPLWARIDTIL